MKKAVSPTKILLMINLPAILLLLLSCNSKGQQAGNQAGITVPSGFSSIIVAESLGQGRHIVVNTNGDIYVSLQRLKNKHGIVALRDANNDSKAEIIEYFGNLAGTGIGIYGGHLYFGSDTAIIRYKLNPYDLLPDSDYEIIAGGFKRNTQHGAKTFTFDDSGNLYVNVGAPSNACQTPDRTLHTRGDDPCPLLNEFGGIWRFGAHMPNQHYLKDGYRYATGLRNCVALRWNSETNQLYAVQHGRDQLHEFWPEIYSEDDGVNLPAEEFFLIKDGGDYGWPYCYYDNRQNKKLLAPEYGGDAKTVGRCADKEQPLIAFPAHIAPNDLLFYTGDMFPPRYKNGAFIAFHGSWNRAPQAQKGFNIVFVPFRGDKPEGGWEIFADGFAGTAEVNSPGDAKYRPCGLAQGPDGSLYVVEDNKGTVWKIVYNK